MAVGVVDLAIATLAGIDDPLTGVKRHDFVEFVMVDHAGKEALLSCETTEADFVKAADIMNDVQNVSDAVIAEVRLVTRIKDFSFNPDTEAPITSNVAERGVIKLQTKSGVRSFSWPSVRDELVGPKDTLIVDPGLIDNPVQNLIDEFTGRGVFNVASMLVDHMWGTGLVSAFRKRGRSYVFREKR
jgi:hypothetical protein